MLILRDNTQRPQPGPTTITVRGDFNRVRLGGVNVYPTTAVVEYEGSNNIISVAGPVSITGNSNTITYLDKGTGAFTLSGQNNAVTVGPSATFTQTDNSISYAVQSSGTIRIYDPMVTGTVFDQPGGLELLYRE